MARIITPDRDPNVMLDKVRRFMQLRNMSDDMLKQANNLKTELAQWVADTGYEDDRGSRWVDLPAPIEGVVALQWQRKVSQNLDEDVAESLIADLGLESRCYKTVQVLDQEAVLDCVKDGLISDEQVEAMFPNKVSWAFVPSKGKRP